MDLEKSYRLQLKEVLEEEPVNNMGKWAKKTKIDSINEKIDWILKIKDVAKEDFDFGSGFDKESWISGYVHGFAVASSIIKSEAEAENGEIDTQSLEDEIKK